MTKRPDIAATLPIVAVVFLAFACDHPERTSANSNDGRVASPLVAPHAAPAVPSVARPPTVRRTPTIYEPPPASRLPAPERRSRVADGIQFDRVSRGAVEIEIDAIGIRASSVARGLVRAGSLSIFQRCHRRWLGRQKEFVVEFSLDKDGKPTGSTVKDSYGSLFDCAKSGLKSLVVKPDEYATVELRVRFLPEPTSNAIAKTASLNVLIEATGMEASKIAKKLESSGVVVALERCNAIGWEFWVVIGERVEDLEVITRGRCISDDVRCSARTAPILTCLESTAARLRVSHPGGAYAKIDLIGNTVSAKPGVVTPSALNSATRSQ